MGLVTAWLAVGLAIACITYGHVVVKWQMNGRALPDSVLEKLIALVTFLFEPWIFSAVALTFVGSLFWMAAMTRLPLSQAFPFTSIPFVTVTVFAMIAFGEPFSLPRLLGVGLIVTGIVIVARA